MFDPRAFQNREVVVSRLNSVNTLDSPSACLLSCCPRNSTFEHITNATNDVRCPCFEEPAISQSAICRPADECKLRKRCAALMLTTTCKSAFSNKSPLLSYPLSLRPPSRAWRPRAHQHVP